MNSTYFLDLVAGNIFGTKVTPAIPGNYYIGLSSTPPSADGTGVNEPKSTAGYARIELDMLGEPENGVVSNTSPISFPESTASWGTITHYVIYDSPSVGDGNLLMYGPLDTPRGMEAASVLTIRTGSLSLSVKNATV